MTLLLWFLRHRSLVHFLTVKCLLRPCFTKFIMYRLLEVKFLRTWSKSLLSSRGGHPPLVDVRPSSRAQRHILEDLGELAPSVQLLDLPVPQMVESVTDTLLRILDFPIAEQVIAVPTVSCSSCPSRSRVPEPQSADQLVEVPTVLSPTRIALQIAEQIVDTPVPHGSARGSLPAQSSAARRPLLSSRRRFTGCIWHMPSAGLPGYIESDTAKAAYAFVGDPALFP